MRFYVCLNDCRIVELYMYIMCLRHVGNMQRDIGVLGVGATHITTSSRTICSSACKVTFRIGAPSRSLLYLEGQLITRTYTHILFSVEEKNTPRPRGATQQRASCAHRIRIVRSGVPRPYRISNLK